MLLKNEFLKAYRQCKQGQISKISRYRPSLVKQLYIYLARTPELGQGLGRILSCGARKPEQT